MSHKFLKYESRYRLQSKIFWHRRSKFFLVSNQRPHLAIEDLWNFLVAKFSDPRHVNIVFWWSSNPRPELPIQVFFFCFTHIFFSVARPDMAIHSRPVWLKKSIVAIQDLIAISITFFTELSIVVFRYFVYCLFSIIDFLFLVGVCCVS